VVGLARATRGIGWIAVALAGGAAACAYPSFDFTRPASSRATHATTTASASGGAGGTHGASGAGGAPHAAGGAAQSTGGTTHGGAAGAHAGGSGATGSAGGAGGHGGGAVPCPTEHLVLSEIRSRGPGGAGDEFVELYNPTMMPVTLDASWKVEARSATAQSYGTRWTGTGIDVPPHGHLLLGGAGYAQEPLADDVMIAFGIADAGSVRLTRDGQVIDAVCYYHDKDTLAALGSGYDCEGTPVSNLPHDDSSAGQSNSDVSFERKPGGAAGACQDTGDNVADFAAAKPANPQSTTSKPAP
jgi:hypothetical protein